MGFKKVIRPFIIFAFLTLVIFLWPKKDFNSDILVSVRKVDGNLIVEAENKNSQPIKKAMIYKNGQVFMRAYESEIVDQFDQGVITFMFDDGWLGTYTEIYPILKKHGYPATVSVITNYIDKTEALSSRHLRKLINNGWDVVSHGVNEKSFLTMTSQEQKSGLLMSKMYLWKKLWAADYFVFPYGDESENIVNSAKKYYKAGRGYGQNYDSDINSFPVDPFAIKIKSLQEETSVLEIVDLIDRAENEKLWLVLVGHHVSSKIQDKFNFHPEKLEKVLNYLDNKKIRVTTFNQALQELNPKMTLIKEGKLVWKFPEYLLDDNAEISIEVDFKRSFSLRVK